jgi:anti-sigma regulatory factor (Ser/Thr protein kinase)/serine/threonine protein phosphatase PrpC
MGSFLSDAWLQSADATPMPMLDAASVAVLRQQVRERGAALGLSATVTGSLVNIASELGHNQLAHARRGLIALRALVRDGVPGLELIAADEGPGIRAPSEALRARPRIPESSDPALRTSLGVGLAAVLEHADEVDFDIRLGEGSCVWARKFAAEVPRRRQLGIYGRPYPGESISGDDAAFVRDDELLLVGLADGLGHGPLAHIASRRAVSTLREQSAASLEQILATVHGALLQTRGAVLATARLHEPSGQLESASVGNAAVRLCGPQLHRRFSGRSFVLGAPGQVRKPVTEREQIGPRDVLILFSDGINSRADLERDLDLLREHPIVIAHQFVERFGRDNDDVLVLVAR